MAENREALDARERELKLMSRLGYRLKVEFDKIYKISQKLLKEEDPKEIQRLQLDIISILNENSENLSEAGNLMTESALFKDYIESNFKSEGDSYEDIMDIYETGISLLIDCHLDMFLSEHKPPLDVVDKDSTYDIYDSALKCKEVANVLSECAVYYYKQDEDEKVNKVLAEALNPEKFASVNEPVKEEQEVSQDSGSKVLDADQNDVDKSFAQSF